MTDDRPPWATGPAKTFSAVDKPGGAKEERESADEQMARIIRPMPEAQMRPWTGKAARDPDWLLKGEPRAVQIEALRRSYGGFWMQQSEEDDSVTQYHVVDRYGLGRSQPSAGWAHFMEQRLGKTPVFLNEFALFRRDHGFKWAVIFAPNAFKPEWVDEAHRFGLDCDAFAFDSVRRTEAQRWIDRNRRHGGLLAVNYETLLSDDTLALLEDLAGDNSLLAFDESVSIKNDSGRHAKTAINLSKKFKVRRDLTGKPVVQGPHDLWAQLRAIGELDGFNPVAFKNRFCKLGGFQGKKIVGSKNEEELQETLAACSFLARRSHWLKTPGTEYVTRKVAMIPEQAAHYRSMEEDFMVTLQAELNANPLFGQDEDHQDLLTITAEQIVTKMLKLQQIASGFIIDEVGKPHDIMPPSSNPKLQELKGMLQNYFESKVIVFAHHRHSIDLLMAELKEFEPALIAGASHMKTYERDMQYEKLRFNSQRSCRVIIGQIQAIRYGHTLQGSPDDPCLNEVFYEGNYSLNDRAQCEERPQGSGQQGLVSIWDLQCSDAEAAMIDALRKKEDVASAVLNYARATGILR